MRSVMKHMGVILAGTALMAATPVQAEDYDWSGFYIGLQGGAQQDETDFASQFFEGDDVIADVADTNDTGFLIGGVHAGYNFQTGGFVFGVEADIELADGESNGFDDDVFDDGVAAFIFDGNGTLETDFQGSVRGRLGWATGRTLIYATGGLAFAQFDGAVLARQINVDFNVTENKNEFSETALGFTVGGGLEHMITDTVSLGAEYRFTDLDAINEFFELGVGAIDLDSDFDTTSHAIRARLTFHFGG